MINFSQLNLANANVNKITKHFITKMPAECRVFQIKDKTVENLTPNLIISICGTMLIAKLECIC